MKIIKYLGFIASAIFIFVLPIIYLGVKYSKVKVVESTTKTVFPIPILIFFAIFILVAMIGLAVWLFALWLQSAKKSKLSFSFIAPFGLVEFALTWVFRMLVIKIKLLIENNVTQFIVDLQGYAYSLGVVMIYVGIGLFIGLSSTIAYAIHEYKKSTP